MQMCKYKIRQLMGTTGFVCKKSPTSPKFQRVGKD